MKSSDRYVSAALSFFVVVIGLSFCPGNMAQAADEGHGNPGQFIENIRKGLSGLSQYFWSPKGDQPASSKSMAPSNDKKAVALKPGKQVSSKNNTLGAPVALEKNSELTTNATTQKITEKAVTKPVIISPDNARKKMITSEKQTTPAKTTLGQTKPQKTFESKTVVDHKNKMARQKKETGSPSQQTAPNKPAGITKLDETATLSKKVKKPIPVTKAKPIIVAKPVPKVPHTALKENTKPAKQAKPATKAQKTTKHTAREKLSPPTSASTIQKKKIEIKKTAKSAPAKNPDTKAPKQPKSVVSEKKKKPNSQIVKKTIGTAAAAAVIASTPDTKAKVQKAPEPKTASGSSRKAAQQLARNDKGTHIWLPNKGSKLSQQFGLTGIPAERLAVIGDLNRTDGRWVFAPKKPGILPSIYGLSLQIHTAGDAGVWIGGGSNWLYVFDKKRTYGSIVGTAKVQKVEATKTAKNTEKLKSSGSDVKKSSSPQKPVSSQDNDKSQISRKQEKSQKPAFKKTAKQVSKNLTKQNEQQSVDKRASIKKDKSQGRAIARSKTARTGKWSRINNHWVYVPADQSGQTAAPSKKNLAQQVAKAPVTGGWVQRNRRWVYVAPRQEAGSRGSIRPKMPNEARNNQPSKKTAKAVVPPANKVAKKPAQKYQNKIKGQTKAKTSTIHSGISVVRKQPVSPKQIPQKSDQGVKRGVTEGPQVSTSAVAKNQKSWVRRNNRWVYIIAKPAEETKPATSLSVAPKAKRAQIARPNKEQKQNLKPQIGQKPSGQFMFFVPGNTPGSGSWFTAPRQFLESARKLEKPGVGAR